MNLNKAPSLSLVIVLYNVSKYSMAIAQQIIPCSQCYNRYVICIHSTVGRSYTLIAAMHQSTYYTVLHNNNIGIASAQQANLILSA